MYFWSMVNIAPIHLVILLPLLPMMRSDWKSRTVSTGWLVQLFVLAGGCDILHCCKIVGYYNRSGAIGTPVRFDTFKYAVNKINRSKK